MRAECSWWALGGPCRAPSAPAATVACGAGQMAVPETEAHYSAAAAAADVARHVYTQACDCRGGGQTKGAWRVAVGAPPIKGNTLCQSDRNGRKREAKRTGDQVGAAKVVAKFLIS